MKHKYRSRITSYDKLVCRFGTYSRNIEQISYYTLKAKLDNNESFNLFIGGYWCPNCKAIMPALVDILNKYDYKIYMLDTRPYRRKRKYTDIRLQLNKSTEHMMQVISSHLMLDLEKKANNTYPLRVPFITRFENGMGKIYFSEEYKKEEMTPELEKQVKHQLEEILK